MGQKRINVAIGILSQKRGQDWHVLIARRPQGVPLAGYWEFPGGKIENSESPCQCLVREFKEEVGIAVRVAEALPLIEHHYPYGFVRIHPFLCCVESDSLRCAEVEETRWVAVNELGRYRFPPANQNLISQLQSHQSLTNNPDRC